MASKLGGGIAKQSPAIDYTAGSITSQMDLAVNFPPMVLVSQKDVDQLASPVNSVHLPFLTLALGVFIAAFLTLRTSVIAASTDDSRLYTDASGISAFFALYFLVMWLRDWKRNADSAREAKKNRVSAKVVVELVKPIAAAAATTPDVQQGTDKSSSGSEAKL